MVQKGFYINTDLCTACKACQIACKDINNLEVGTLFRRVHELEAGQFPSPRAYNISMSCNHCASPRCVANCPTGAMYKRPEDGIVLHDDKRCIGCRLCTWSCPYEAPQYIEEKGMVGKCSLCVDLVQDGEQPACAASCLMRCIEIDDVEVLRQKYGAKSDMPGLPGSSVTEPSVVINVHRSLS